jgi:hypothetical protein
MLLNALRNTTRIGTNRYIGVIFVSDLQKYNIITPNIQRILDDVRVKDIVEYQINCYKQFQTFNYFGTINVQHCVESDEYFLIDGQHRYESMKTIYNQMGHNMDVVVEYVQVPDMTILRNNYKIINQNTILPEFPEHIDKNIPESVANYFRKQYPTMWSKTTDARRPNISWVYFQEALGVLCDHLKITNAEELKMIVSEHNSILKTWDVINFPDYNSIQNMLKKCSMSGFYLGLFKYTSDEFRYKWVSDIIYARTGIDHQKEKRVRNSKKVPQSVKNVAWSRYVGEVYSAYCICCQTEEIKSTNFHAGHIVSHANGGLAIVNNILPICSVCNLSMGARNMDEYISTHYPDNLAAFQLKQYRVSCESYNMSKCM